MEADRDHRIGFKILNFAFKLLPFEFESSAEFIANWTWVSSQISV